MIETGFCFGYFNFVEILPYELSNFIVIPFEKINDKGKKESGLEPLSVTHTKNHIFILYNDCCKYFPHIPKKTKIFTGSDIDILYENDDIVDVIFKKCFI